MRIVPFAIAAFLRLSAAAAERDVEFGRTAAAASSVVVSEEGESSSGAPPLRRRAQSAAPGSRQRKQLQVQKGKERRYEEEATAEDEEEEEYDPYLGLSPREDRRTAGQERGRRHGRDDLQEFASEVMPRYFKQSKFTSFTRKLKRWGFIRVARGIEMGSYFHPQFLRDESTKCRQMVCDSTIRNTAEFEKQQQEPNSEAPPTTVTTNNHVETIAAQRLLLNKLQMQQLEIKYQIYTQMLQNKRDGIIVNTPQQQVATSNGGCLSSPAPHGRAKAA